MLKTPEILLNNTDNGIDFDKIQKDSRVILNGGYEKPEYNFFIGDVGVFTRSNFSVITGKAKSYKSTLLSLITSPFFTNHVHFKRFMAAYDGKVKLFDTEQSKFHIHRLVYYILNGAKITDHPAYFDVYSLRPYSPDQRIEFIEAELKKDENVNFVIIDGIRDLVTDINDADQATRISTLLMRWTYEKNCHISTVLHQNKGDNNARGHLGSELVNKAETVISVEKNNDGMSAVVKCEQSRGMEFQNFQFGINSDNHLWVEEEPELDF